VSQRKTATKTRSKRSPSHSTKKPVAKSSPKAKSSSAKRSSAAKPRRAGDTEVTIDRRRPAGRTIEEAPQVPIQPAAPPLERRAKVNRRRQIDPTTCERDYTDDEVEFMNAIDDYKRTSGRMFPTCSEVLEVVRSLGYAKRSTAELATRVPAANGDSAIEPTANEGGAFATTHVTTESDWIA